MDNSSLFKEGSQDILKENLIDEQDYVLVPGKAWTEVLRWYGLMQHQKPIPRHVIHHQGMLRKYLKVEVYLMTLKLNYNQMDDVFSSQFRYADTIKRH